MSDLTAQFEQAANDAQSLSQKPNNDQLLTIYSLYKQATKGDVSGKRPGFTNPVGRAKYDAWAKCKGTGQDEAKQQYIDFIGGLS